MHCYLHCAFELFDGVILFGEDFFEFLVFGDLVELLLLGNILADVSLRTLLLVDKSSNLGVRHLEDSLNDVRGGCDDMLNIVLADLVIEFLEDLFCV